MLGENLQDKIASLCEKRSIEITRIEALSLPNEDMFICFVTDDTLSRAEDERSAIQASVENELQVPGKHLTIGFRPASTLDNTSSPKETGTGLRSTQAKDLKRLLLTHSRASKVNPGLEYRESESASVEDASLMKNTVINGRRGVGKTALLWEVRRRVQTQGHYTVWINTQVHRGASPELFALAVFEEILLQIEQVASTNELSKCEELLARIQTGRQQDNALQTVNSLTPELHNLLSKKFSNQALGFYIFLDDLYLFPIEDQAQLLDYLYRPLRDCNACLKISTIRHLSKIFDFDKQFGLQIPHDAIELDLDITLENPKSTVDFLESILEAFIVQAGLGRISNLMDSKTRGRLALASGGVPRDYLTILATAMDVAIKNRDDATKVTSQSVNESAGKYAQVQREEFELDARSGRGEDSKLLFDTIDRLRTLVRDRKEYTFFKVDISSLSTEEEERLGQLVDLRAIHTIQKSFSGKRKGSGTLSLIHI